MKIKSIIAVFTILCLGLSLGNSFAQEGNPGITEKNYSYYEPDVLFSDYLFEDVRPFSPTDVGNKEKFADKNNDTKTQYTLGYMYQYGKGVEQDSKKAEKWFLKAANNNDTSAMLALGRLYKKGETLQGLPGSTSKALQWFHEAARQRDPNAFYELGVLYETGDGVFPNDKKAFGYYKIAAESGILNAHVKLGLFYQHGRGTKKDINKAIQHFKILDQKTDDENVKFHVKSFLGTIFADLAKEGTKEERFRWLNLAARYGHIKSLITLADAYRDARGVGQDYDKAIKLYEIAAKRENIYAMENLGYIYSNGLGVEQDYKEALKWYLGAAERGSAEAAWNVGNFYFNGHGVDKDLKESKKWFDRSQILGRK